MIFLTVSLGLIMKTVILNSFSSLEEDRVISNVERAVNALSTDIQFLSSVNADWAAWDDTYEFIMNGNEEYIDSNMVDPTFVLNQFNFMIYTDSFGKIVHAKSYDLINRTTIPFPDELLDSLTDKAFQSISHNEKGIKGIIMSSKGPAMVSSHPIVTSEYEGPTRGHLIVGRYLDSRRLEKLEETTKLSLSLQQNIDRKLDTSFIRYKATQLPVSIQVLSKSEISGKAMLRDIYGEPLLDMVVDMDRDIYKQGQASLNYLILSLVVTSIFFALVSLVSLEKVVLSRIMKLTTNLAGIRNSKDLSSRVPISGKDELSRLEIEFNSMMGALEKSQHKIRHQAYHDALTDLPNRFLFNDHLEQTLKNAEKNSTMAAVIFIDLDRFKQINDTLGHDVGDVLLQAASETLISCLSQHDSIARMGGDEFTFILSNMTDKEDILNVAKKVLNNLSTPFNIKGHELFVSASIGISVYPEDGSDSETLIKHADVAMYEAKNQGGNQYQLYETAMSERAYDKLMLENALHKALEREEFMIYYQPRLDLETGLIMGLEALIRWRHSEKGMISPQDFIPLSEETGLIIPLSEWIIRQACSQVKTWQSLGYFDLNISVNLSKVQFQQSDFVDKVKQILNETGLSPEHLELEITESMTMHDMEIAVQQLNELRELGIKVAIDDFGTGYSSLGYMKKLPVHTIKIDRSFVMNVPNDPVDSAIISSMIGMAHELNLNVVAEGVETEEQLHFLRKKKCQEVQGFLFSPPVPSTDIEHLLFNNKNNKKLSS